MSDLVRFGVAMERGLLTEFDERIARKGYENRSEALRDLVRADLTRAAREGGQVVAGTLTVVHARKQTEQLTRLVDASLVAGGGQGDEAAAAVLSWSTTALDNARALSTGVVLGPSARLGELAARIGTVRGVLSSELAIACAMGSDPSPGLL